MSDETIFSSSPATSEIAIGADDLVELDAGEVRRQQVETVASAAQTGATLMFVESLADPDWRVRRAAAAALAGDADTDPSGLLCSLLASENAGERNAAIKALIKRGTDSVPALLNELRSPDPDVRNFACVALGQIGEAHAVEPVLAIANDDPDDNVRYMAIEALGRIGDDRATADLIMHLEEDPWLAAVAAEALGLIGGARALHALLGKLAEDPVGLVAAEALGLLDDPRALIPLVRAASTFGPLLGMPALCAIGRIVGSASSGNTAVIEIIRPIAREMATPGLVQSLVLALAERGETRERALHAAVWLGLPELAPSVCVAADTPEHAPLAVDYLVQDLDAVRDHIAAAATSEYPSVRAVAAMAIARAGDERDLPTAITLLADDNQSVCIAAIKALARVGGAAEAPRLVELLPSGVDEISFAAADALGVLGVVGLCPRLIQLAEHDEPVVRRAVARAFSAARLDAADEIITRCLLTLARDPDPRVRAEITAALGYATNVDTVSALLVLSLDEDRNVRLAAIRTLGRRQEPAARRALRGATSDESRSIRAAAARGLTADLAAEDVELALTLLRDSDPGTIIATVRGLARSGAPGTTQAIVRLCDHESADVREAVLRAIAASEPETARDLAAVVLSSNEPVWSVRLAAVEALVGCDGSGGAREIVERCLHDREPMVREAAIAAVPDAFGADAADTLVALLDNDELREPTRRALEAMGPPAAASLVQAFDELDGPARRAAAFALGTMHSTEACSALETILTHGDAEDRWSATMAIVTCGCAPDVQLAESVSEQLDETVAAVLRAAARGCSCVCG